MGWHTPSRAWASGPWTLALRGDELADIRYGGVSVLRSTRAVVRDLDWNTPDLVVDEVADEGAALVMTVHSRGFGSSFSGTVSVTASDPELEVAADLVSASAFATNRTGLVVLHPPQLAGSALEVQHADGSIERTAFPAAISAHQPVLDISRLSWEAGGLRVATRFEGDVFEMEDQRNWTDASYKTYNRPLALPFPYEIAAGDTVRQRVTIRVEGMPVPAADGAPDRLELAAGGTVPQIGVCAATGPDPAPAAHPVGQTLLVELDLRAPNWRAALRRAAASPLPLDVRFVVAPDRYDLLAGAVAELAGAAVARVGVFDASGDARHVSPRAAVHALRTALDAAGLRPPIVGGSRAHFTELNRERHRLPDDLDGVTVALTPLFHSTGSEQLVESVAMQRLVARQAVALAPGAPVHVGPITLRPRYNDVATAPEPMPVRTDLADGYGAQFTGADDPRQTSAELAAWTIASAAALAVPGVSSLSFFEEWGPRGIRSSSGEPYPVAEAIEALASLRGEALRADSPDGLVWAIGATHGAESTVLVASLDASPRNADVVLPNGDARTVDLPAFGWHRITVRG